MKHQISIASDVGSVRTHNEDAVGASGDLTEVRLPRWHSERRDHCWVAVADGIGGSPAGEVASELAVRMFASIVDRLMTAEDVRSSVIAIDHELRSTSERFPQTFGMGTTLAAVLVRGDACLWVNLGDSRV